MKTKMLAMMAIAAVAFAAIAIAVPMAEDSDATAVAPTTYKAGTNNLRVIAYADETLLIDTNKMTNLSEYREYTIEVKVGSTSGTYTAGTNTIGPVSLQNGRIYVSAPALDATTNKYTQVKIFGYGNATELDTVTFEYVSTVATYEIHTAHSTNWATVNTITSEVEWSDSESAASRGVTHKMNKDMNTTAFDGTAYGYTLKGFTTTVGDASTLVIEPTITMKCEDIIMATGAITSNKVVLYAYWEKTVYNIYVYDDSTSAYVQTAADIKISDNVVAKATASTKVEGASFGLLRVVQDTTYGNYKYTVTLYKDNTSAEASKVKTDGTEGSYTFLNNGTYRINVTSNDLYIKVTAETISVPVSSAFALTVDEISNSTNVGVVNVSLDLFDYSPVVSGTASKETLTLDGTYYVPADDGVRIYGNLGDLNKADNTKLTYTLYADNASNDTLLTENTGVAKLGIASDGKFTEEHRSYDLHLVLGATYCIYAVQGTLNDVNNTDSDVSTPWSLVSA